MERGKVFGEGLLASVDSYALHRADSISARPFSHVGSSICTDKNLLNFFISPWATRWFL